MSDVNFVAVAGDAGCGKSSLVMAFKPGGYVDSMPKMPKALNTNVEVNGKTVRVVIREFPAGDSLAYFRSSVYSIVDAYILCFAIDNPTSLINAVDKCYAELKQSAPDTPVVLAGLKSDLRFDTSLSSKLVSHDQGLATSQKIGATHYFECSSITLESVQDLLTAVTTVILKK